MVQLLAPYIDHESHSAQRHRQTDGQKDRRHAYTNSRSYCVAERSAKNVAYYCTLAVVIMGLYKLLHLVINFMRI